LFTTEISQFFKNFDKYSKKTMRLKIKLFGTRKYSELGKQLYLILLRALSTDDAAQRLVTTRIYFKCLCSELFSYSGENTQPVNKMSQIKSYYELSI